MTNKSFTNLYYQSSYKYLSRIDALNSTINSIVDINKTEY